MNRPETNNPAREDDADRVVPAASWGEKEEAREIALLDAVISYDTLQRLVEEAAAPEECGETNSTLAHEIRPVNIDDEMLRNSYLDYAMTVIVGRALNPLVAADRLRTLSRRTVGEPQGLICPFEYGDYYSTPLTLLQLQKQALTAALALLRLTQAARKERISALLLKMLNSANAACYGLPLFAYGPELSEYRHRLR